MEFDYNYWYWSQLTEKDLIHIINTKGLNTESKRAQQELDRRIQEQTEFLEL